MAKGIIVVDIPKTCWECPCYMEGYLNGSSGGDWCKVTGEEIYSYIAKRNCPIKELPRKLEKDEVSLGRVSRYAKFEDGWNACIDEILGE